MLLLKNIVTNSTTILVNIKQRGEEILSKPTIERLVICGDSLSDRGLLYNNPVLGPIVKLGPLGDKKDSPEHRFGNGYIWDDLLICFLASQSEINDISSQNNTRETQYALNAEIADAVITQSPVSQSTVPQSPYKANAVITKSIFSQSTNNANTVKNIVSDNADTSDEVISHDDSHHYISSETIMRNEKFREKHDFYLNNPKAVTLNGQDRVISLAEGGATAYDYGQLKEVKLSSPITWLRFIYGKFLSNISKQHAQLINISQTNDKDKTLYIDLIGANDLITIPNNLNKDAAKKAVDARIANIQKLIDEGYKNFCIINLPLLSHVPKYQNLGEAEEVSKYYNEYLAQEINQLSAQINNPDITIKEIELDKIYNNIMQDQKIVASLKNENFIDKQNPNAWSWDGLHPTTKITSLIGCNIYDKIVKDFDVNFSVKTDPQFINEAAPEAPKSFWTKCWDLLSGKKNNQSSSTTHATVHKCFNTLPGTINTTPHTTSEHISALNPSDLQQRQSELDLSALQQKNSFNPPASNHQYLHHDKKTPGPGK